MAYLDILSVVAVSRVVDRIDFVEMVLVNPKLLYTPDSGVKPEPLYLFPEASKR